MPDITMCPGGKCTKRYTCYRFTANPTPNWQAYFTEIPAVKNGKKYECEHYLKIKKNRRQIL